MKKNISFFNGKKNLGIVFIINKSETCLLLT